MRKFIRLSTLAIVLLVFVLSGLLSSCAEKVCPANGRETLHRQLTKINKKRKRDRGLFPKSMRNYQSKKKKKEEPETEETESEEPAEEEGGT